MAELKLNIIVENLDRLKKRLSNIPIGKTASGGTKGDTNSKKSGGGKLAFLAGGIFGLLAGVLTNIETVSGLVSITAGLINQLVSPFVPFLLTVLKPLTILLSFLAGYMLAFFKDPVRALIKMSLFIVNGIIAAIEFGLNKVVQAINLIVRGINKLIPGSRLDIPLMSGFELPRFQEALVIKAYDELQEDLTSAASDGSTTLQEGTKAFVKFAEGLGNSFIKNSELSKITTDAVARGLDETSFLGALLEVGSNDIEKTWTNTINTMLDVGKSIDKKARELADQLDIDIETGSTFKQTFVKPARSSGFEDFFNNIGKKQMASFSNSNRTNKINVNINGPINKDSVNPVVEELRKKIGLRGPF